MPLVYNKLGYTDDQVLSDFQTFLENNSGLSCYLVDLTSASTSIMIESITDQRYAYGCAGVVQIISVPNIDISSIVQYIH